ncbi:MAG: alpha/beta fold hydrolase [Bosea sp. (in: a-proteobacteria)]
MKNVSFSGVSGNALQASLWGEGARVALLLHGGGQTRHAWDNTGLALAKAGWTAIALDQRGHGDSAWAEDAAYSFADYGRDVIEVAKQIAVQFGAQPVAIGASLGGIASLSSFVLVDEPVLAGLVLVDIIPKMDPRGVAHVQGFMRAKAQEGFASVEEAADAIAAYLPHRPRPRSLAGLAKNLRQHADGRFRWHWDPRFLDGPTPVGHGWESLEPKLDAAARALPVPLLLVRGGGSELVLPEAAKAFLATVPDGEYADIAEARHMVAGDKNDAFGNAVITFLERRFPA